MKKLLVSRGLMSLILCVIIGCSTPTGQKLNRLDLGMSRAQVRDILGNNYIARASKTDTNGARLELWEYTDKKSKEVYRIYFKDGQLAQWGQRGNQDFPDLNLPK